MKTPFFTHPFFKYLTIFMGLWAGLFPPEGHGQTLQVVTKSIDRTFAFAEVSKVYIQAERADIEVSTWDKPEVKITIELTSKHPDQAVAKNDLAYFKYLIETAKNTLYARNYILLPKGAARPQANLKARYKVVLPASGEVQIENSFGKINIDGLGKETQLQAAFCTVVLQNISGKTTLDTRFGTLHAENMNGNVALKTDQSDCLLKNVRGRWRIRAEHGSIEFDTDKTLVEIDLKTTQTVVKYRAALTIKTP